MSLKVEWLAGLKPEDKAERADMIRSAGPTLRLLKSILEKRLDAKLAAMLGKQNYESASWPYAQADGIAEQRVLREIIELIDLTKDE